MTVRVLGLFSAATYATSFTRQTRPTERREHIRKAEMHGRKSSTLKNSLHAKAFETAARNSQGRLHTLAIPPLIPYNITLYGNFF
jgi:hypothetical protein